MNIKKWQIIGFFFTVILGALLHFVFSWSGESTLVAPIAAVNESTWEHIKLLIVPILIFGLIEYIVYGYNIENFIPIKFVSILIGMLSIVVIFYTYTGIVGDNYLVIDILLFIISVALSYCFSSKYLDTNMFISKIAQVLGLLGIILLVTSLVMFTYHPPKINLFLDPSGSYGIPN